MISTAPTARIFSRYAPAALALLRGIFGVSASVLGAGHAAAETPVSPPDYRSAAAAPVEWRNFSRRLQQRLQERLAAQDDDARRLYEVMARRTSATSDRGVIFNVRAWIEPGGKVERVEFDAPEEDRAAAESLRRLMRVEGVGAPPADMLQPVRLGLYLQPKAPEKAEK